MNLVVDMGNSRIKVALVDGGCSVEILHGKEFDCNIESQIGVLKARYSLESYCLLDTWRCIDHRRVTQSTRV